MNQTWQLPAFAGYLLLGLPLAASCAREANTLEEAESQGGGGSTPGSAGAVASKAGAGKGGSASGAFGGTNSKGGGGGKPGTAGSSASDGGDGATAGSVGTAGGTGGGGGSGSGSGGSGSSVPPDVLARASVIVYYQTSHATALDGTIQMKLFIENRSADPLPMANVEIRYWFTAEVATELHQYYTGPEAKQPQAVFVSDADNSHASMTFGGGSIAKGADLNASEVQLEVSSNAGKFDQSDDFSWQPGASASTPNDKITLYLADTLLWGCEPSGVCADAAGGNGAGGAP